MIAERPAQQRVVPHDLAAEVSVLGALLLDAEAVARVIELIEPEDFYRENNGSIYRAAVNLFREGRPIDNVTLATELTRSGVLERVGGRAHLALLQEQVPTAANVEHYAQTVRAKATKRRLIAAGQRSMALGFDEEVPADAAVEQAQATHFELADRQETGGFAALADLLRPAWDRVSEQAESGGRVVGGLATGFADLDRLLTGIKPGNYVVIGGASSMGKTSLAMQLATNVAIDQRVPVAVFSLEMSSEELVERMLCERARVDAQRLKRGIVGDAEFARLGEALGPLSEAPIWIDDTPALDELSLRLRARQVHARHKIGLFVVDYLQLMRGRGKSDDRVREVTAISHALKAVARELGVPVIALSQLSRALASRTDKRPILSDLRESGSIEADADAVMFVYRDEYYNREKTDKPGIAEIIVAKHRNGPTGTVELLFRKEYTRFETLERRQAGGLGSGD